MDSGKIITRITRAGAVIMSTVVSFAVYPPMLSATDNDGVNWKNIFTFFAGMLSILAYDQFRKRRDIKPFAYTLMALLFACLIGYQVMYNKYSLNCYEKFRVVISDAPVKHTVQPDLDGWKNKQIPNPLQELVHAYQCSSSEVWDMKDLAFPYYGMITLYFAIILIITLLTVILSDQLNSQKQPLP